MRPWLPLAAVIAALVTGCGDDEAAMPGDGAPTPQQSAGDLWGRSFISTAVTERGEARPLVADTRIRVTFGQENQGDLGWKAGCNSFGGDVKIAASRLLVGQTVSTQMGCPGELEKQDRWLAEFFGSNPRWRLSDGLLALESGEIVVEMEEEETPPRTEEQSPSARPSAVSSCSEGIRQADPQWRRKSSVTGPFGLYGEGRDFRGIQRQGEGFVAKLPAIAARGAIVTLRVPSREQGSVALGYLGVRGHVERVTFEACADRPATAWPGELVLADRRPVTLNVEVEGQPKVPIRVGRL